MAAEVSRMPRSRRDAAAPTPERLVAVQIREQTPQEIEQVLELSARTSPARRVLLKAETVGRVVATPAARGARHDEGTTLLRLDLGDRQARLTQAQAAVHQRELEYEAQQTLAPDGYISEAAVAGALAQLEGARAELERARLDLQRMVVRAPFDGVLLEREVELGDYVTPGDPLLSFLDDRKLIVTGDVSEQHVEALTPGMAASATLVDGNTRQGRLRYIAPLADAGTRTFVVELEIDNGQGKVPLGATAQLHLPLGTVLAHPISPALLTLDDEGRLGVKIVGSDDVVELVTVSVARAEADTIWVTGLPDLARIITVGHGFVSAGQRVETRFQAGPGADTAQLIDAVGRPAAASAGGVASGHAGAVPGHLHAAGLTS
jgi:multidrug efflux system membrane fusion protein